MKKKKKTENRSVINGREFIVSGNRINCTHTFMASSCQVCAYCVPSQEVPGSYYCTEGGKGLLDVQGNVSLSEHEID